MDIRTLASIVLLTVFFFAGWHAATYTQPARRYIDSRTAADAKLPPFSGAVLAGDTLYLSGEIGLDADRKVPATAEAEARNVMNQIQKRLQSAGLTMDDLVSVQIFTPDVANYDAFNEVYRTYFKQEFPARAFVGSGPLLFGARFEVQGIAVRR